MTASPTSLNNSEDIICPCCGRRFRGDLQIGCPQCGARSVGPPLAPPAHMLPPLGRAGVTFASGTALLLTLIGGTLIELLSGAGLSLKFWRIVAAAETVAWRAKWTLLPAAVLSSYLGVRYVLRQVVAVGEPPPGGRRFARSGVLMSSSVAFLLLVLIAITVPERLRQRELAQQAEIDSLVHMTQAVFLRYQTQFGTLPAELTQLRNLPDEDGAVAYVLANFEKEAYTPSSLQAAARAPRTRSRRSDAATAARRRIAFRNNTNDMTTSGLTFTNYDLVWAGEDKVLGTNDDRIIRDGEFVNLSAQRTPAPLNSAAPMDVRTDAPKSRGSK